MKLGQEQQNKYVKHKRKENNRYDSRCVFLDNKKKCKATQFIHETHITSLTKLGEDRTKRKLLIIQLMIVAKNFFIKIP
jgi:hypothetical protein